jgi:hypothetical protein
MNQGSVYSLLNGSAGDPITQISIFYLAQADIALYALGIDAVTDVADTALSIG